MNNRLTLVIPTYNEARIISRTLATVISAFEAHSKVPWNIIVADNASKDGTADVVEAMKDPRVKALRLSQKGRGRAIRAAFTAAGGGIVAFTDADLPIVPEEVLKGVDLILGGECEIVIGTRLSGGGAMDNRMWLRKLSSRVFHLLAKVITGLKASDSQCPLRIMNERTTPIMLATVDPTWWSELECILLAEKLRIPMKELPVTWLEGRYEERKSTVKVVQDGLKAIKAMVKMRFYLPPIEKSLRKSFATPPRT
jgi:glycosyltransferase involved in cell wall biosynthesis